jgi:hypothetical protein
VLHHQVPVLFITSGGLQQPFVRLPGTLAIPISGYPVRNYVLTHQLSRLFLID